MELIPVLSTIILVATICTFILAIGAYILYKIRESKGLHVTAPEPASVKAELYSPVEATVQVPQPGPAIAPQPAYFQPKLTPVQTQAKEYKFLKYTSEGYVDPSKEDKTSGVPKWK